MQKPRVVEIQEKCEACEGRGYVYIRSGEDDVDKDTCDYCDGTGHNIIEVAVQERAA